MSNIVLRPRQQTWIEGIRAALADGHSRVMAQAPTGFGKTVCFSYIAESAAMNYGNRTFILVHRKELIRQTSKSLHKNGIAHGVIASGYPVTNHPIQVCSVQTFVRRYAKYERPELIVIDEGHHCVAPQYMEIIEWAGDESVILAVTATPMRVNGTGFDKHPCRNDDCPSGPRHHDHPLFTHLVTGPEIWTLVEEGWLCRPVLYGPKIEGLDLSDVDVLGGEYNNKKLSAKMGDPKIIGSAVENYVKFLPHLPATVVFATSVQNARDLADKFKGEGIPAESIDGTMDDFERAQIIGRIESRETRCLMSCSLVDEGFDLPLIEAMVDYAPTKSTPRHIQKIGRVLRIDEGKTEAAIIDHVENWREHWEATKAIFGIEPGALQWKLEGRKKRTNSAKGATLTTCPKCFRCFLPADVCPACGHVLREAGGGGGRDIEQVDGELVRLDLAALAKREQAKPLRPRRNVVEKLIRLDDDKYFDPEQCSCSTSRHPPCGYCTRSAG